MNIIAAIIEDEAPARETLKSYLSRYYENIMVVIELDTVESSLSYLQKNKVDILFLDVQLKDGNGLDILNQIDTSKYKIVFTTAFDNYTLEAFKNKSFGYLIKPLDPDDFKEIVDRVIKDLSVQMEPMQLKLRVPILGGYKWIEYSDIIRCESESNYTKIFTERKSRVYVVSRTLKSIEEELKPSNDFIRVHQSHLINLSFVAEFELHRNFLELKTKDQIPVSRRMKQGLFLKLGGK